MFSHENVIEMKKSFVSVKEFEFFIRDYPYSSTKEISNFINNCPCVQRLTLEVNDINFYNKLINLIKSSEHNKVFAIVEKERRFIY